MLAGLSSSDDGKDATLADQLMGKDRDKMMGGVGLGGTLGNISRLCWLACLAVMMGNMLH